MSSGPNDMTVQYGSITGIGLLSDRATLLGTMYMS